MARTDGGAVTLPGAALGTGQDGAGADPASTDLASTDLASTGDRARLRRVLGRMDTVCFLLSAMIVTDTIGAVATGGGQAFTWLVVLAVTFFVPSALISAELGAALPEEGGVYVWVRRALGRYAGALASLLYWACTPMWVGGSVAVLSMAVWQKFVGPLPAAGQFGLGAAFIAMATVTAVIPLKSGKWIPVSGTAGQALLLVFFTVTVAVYGAQHGVHGIAAGDLAPTGTVFIAVAPVLLFSFSGAELPAAAAEEMTDPRRDIPAAIGQAGAALIVMYAVPVLAVLIVLPAGAVTSLHGFLDALKTVLTVYGGSAGDPGGTPVLAGGGQIAGWACAALFIWVLMSSAAAWIMGAGRAQAAACLDGAGPRFLGRVSARTGVPARIGLLSGAIALLVMAAGVAVTGQDNQKYFSAALTAVIALVVLAYLLIFPAFAVLRRRRPNLPRPFLVPGGRAGAAVVTIAATGWSALAAACLLWPGLGTAHPDAHLPAGFAGQRGLFELLVLTPVVVIVAAATAYCLATRYRNPSPSHKEE